MDFRVVHPVPLTMAHVVADFHVLDALRKGQRRGSQQPAGPRPGTGDEQARGRVAFAEGLLDVATNGVEFTPEVLDVCIAQMRIGADVGDRHERSCRYGRTEWSEALLRTRGVARTTGRLMETTAARRRKPSLPRPSPG